MKYSLRKTYMVIACMALLLAVPPEGCAETDFDVVHRDGKQDTVSVEFDFNKLEVKKCLPIPFLDIRTVRSVREDGNITLTLTVHGRIVDSENVLYEISGYYLDTPGTFSDYDFLLRYSNRAADFSYDESNHTDVTNRTEVEGGNLIFRLPVSLFQNATRFDFTARCVAYSSDNGKTFMDSTEHLEPVSIQFGYHYDPDTLRLTLVVLFIAFGILMGHRKRTSIILKTSSRKRCQLCGSLVEGKNFCYKCGNDDFDDE